MKWYSVCHKCNAPLEPRFVANCYTKKMFIKEYKKIRPIFLDNNIIMYTFVGLELKRVCYACFVNKVKINPKLLRFRETGQLKHFAPRSKSKTQSEIVHWFEGLLRTARSQGLIT